MDQIVHAVNSNGLASSAASFALGLACANIPLLVQKLVELLAPWIRKHPEVAEAIVNELKKDVDAVAKSPADAAKTSDAPKAS